MIHEWESNNSDDSMQQIRLIDHFQASHDMKYFLSFGLLTWYFAWWQFALVTVERAILPYFIQYWKRWKSWGVNWIYRHFTRNIQPFGLSSICVVWNIDETWTRDLQQWQHHRTDTLDRSLKSYPLSEILLTFWVVEFIVLSVWFATTTRRNIYNIR